ncbi:hypothetical protein FNV43_RR05126 [Rhamnella rubrinervis]|uniref:Pyrimidine 5-nucleotidase n=1 Tax=Rhamnella rubrinervis TaxID=2594499 RepID=A0A8K0HND1_9ROSA|nr:hypothetical protein FNV43_RR05126 [Rhamnella rubrinervis]
MEYENQYQQALGPKYECLLFDVDDTLYPFGSGLLKNCTKNIEEYMVQKLGIDEMEVSEMNSAFYKHYGTSMAGLRAFGYDFDYDDYHSFVHGRLPYEVLKPDHVLRSLLLSLPIRKVIFSNADIVHVNKVLSKLGLNDCFDEIICFETLNPTKSNVQDQPVLTDTSTIAIYKEGPAVLLPETPIVCKPFEDAFSQAFKIANINPQTTVFFDDSIRNIQSGKRMGLHTVLVGSSQRREGVDCAIESIHNIKEAIPELCQIDDHNKEHDLQMFSRNLGLQTSVTA